MMNSATFYLLEQEDAYIFLAQVCHLVSQYYQQGLRVFILADSKSQAELIDEYLWQQSLDEFVPHALVGESKKSSVSVEIGWQGVGYSGIRQVLINLTESVATFAPSFAQVIEFVPCDESLKQKARERYKIYSIAGRKINTLAMAPC